MKRPLGIAVAAMIILAAQGALAQTPADFFGLAGSQMTHFEKGKRPSGERDDRLTREAARRGMLSRRSASEDSLSSKRGRRARGVVPSGLGEDSLRVIAISDSLDKWGARNHIETVAEDSLKRIEAKPLPFLPAFDAAVEIAGQGDGDNRTIATGRTLYDVPFNGAMNTHLTVYGNVGGIVNANSTTPIDTLLANTNELRSSRSGLHLGLGLWYLLNSREGNASWVPSFFVGGRSNRVIAQDGKSVDFSQFQTGAALSVGIGYIEGKSHPLGVSVGGVCSFFSPTAYKQVFGTEKSSRWDGHMTLLIPISDEGVGILFEDVVSEGVRPTWHAGVAFAAKDKSKSGEGTQH